MSGIGQHQVSVSYTMKRITVHYQGQHTNASSKIKITTFEGHVLTYNHSHQECRFGQNSQVHLDQRHHQDLSKKRATKQYTQILPLYFGRLQSL